MYCAQSPPAGSKLLQAFLCQSARPEATLVICIPFSAPVQLFHSIYLTEDHLDFCSALGDELGSGVLSFSQWMLSPFRITSASNLYVQHGGKVLVRCEENC